MLFFEKGKPTQKVCYYQLNLDRNLGKTKPLNENDLAEFVELQKTFADSEKSWIVNVADIAPKGHNTGTKGVALRDKATTTIAPEGRNSYANDSAPSGLGSSNYDLSVKKPNKKEEAAQRQPQAILEEMKALDEESAEILNSILESI